jgi:hypothetical protein
MRAAAHAYGGTAGLRMSDRDARAATRIIVSAWSPWHRVMVTSTLWQRRPQQRERVTRGRRVISRTQTVARDLARERPRRVLPASCRTLARRFSCSRGPQPPATCRSEARPLPLTSDRRRDNIGVKRGAARRHPSACGRDRHLRRRGSWLLGRSAGGGRAWAAQTRLAT